MNKDIGFIQQHAEKLVLGVALLFLIAVGLIYWAGVLGDPHGTPTAAIDDVENAADRLDTKINSDEIPSEMTDYPIPNFAARFENEYAKPVTELTAFRSRPDTPGLAKNVLDVGVIDYAPLHLPSPPMADAFNIKFDHAVLAEPELVQNPGDREFVANVRRIIGDKTPADFQYVSVMAEFPLREWSHRLDNDPPIGFDRIPENVWRSKLGIASVYLIRERLDPATGQWGERTTIEPLPVANALAELPLDGLDALDPLLLGQVQELVKGNQGAIAQAAFPPTKYRPWLPPTGANRILSPEQQKVLTGIESDIRRLERRLNTLRGIDPNPRNPQRTPPTRQPGGYDEGGGGGYGDLGGGPNTTTRTPRRNTGDASAAREAAEREREQQQIQRVETELLEKRQEKNTLLGIEEDESQQRFLGSRGFFPEEGGGYGQGGYGQGGYGAPDGGYGGPQPLPGRPQGGFGQLRGGPEEPDVPETVRVWAHDLSAKPGETYRYKLVVAVMNPLFQYTRVPAEQRRDNEYKLALSPSEEQIEAAPWTTAVTLDPTSYFFFVRGNAGQSRATVEVWRVYDGLWRNSEFDELPGNPIGDVESIEIAGRNRAVDMQVGAVLLDIDTVQTANNQAEIRMVYMLPDGQIQSRTLNADKRSPKRDQLQAELERLSEPVALRN